MNVEQFRSLIDKGLSRQAPPASREAFYDRLRGAVRQRLSQADDPFAIETALDVAIAGYEADNHPPKSDRSFRAPSSEPQTLSAWVVTQVVAGCGALTALIDFLKPIANLESGVAIVAVMVALVLTALLRARAGHRAVLRGFQIAAIILAAAMVGLFGLQVLSPEAAPNGVLAASIPGFSALQQSLLGIEASAKRTEANTAVTATNTQQTAMNTAKTNDILSSAFRSPVEAMTSAGYPQTVEGVIKALDEENADVMYAYLVYVPDLTPDEVWEAMAHVRAFNTRTGAYFGELVNRQKTSTKRQVRIDAAPLIEALSHTQTTGIAGVFCGGTPPTTWPQKIRRLFPLHNGDCESADSMYGAYRAFTPILSGPL